MPALFRLAAALLLAAPALAACSSGTASGGGAAPAPAASAPAGAMDFTGEWEFTVNLPRGTLQGVWRISYADGRYTGVFQAEGQNPTPVRAFSVSGTRFSMTVEMGADLYTFSGTAESARTINGAVNFRGGMGRLRAVRRG
jgi:hypothetical protein